MSDRERSSQPLELFLREMIRAQGPISFATYMEQVLYHPQLGYYSSGRGAIGRRGDYFTSVSVGPLFGRMLAAQFAEVWEKLERPNEFTLVEQGAHDGLFARDVLTHLRESEPECFAKIRYRIVEPFPILRERQERILQPFAGKVEWAESIETMAPFCGVHFSNELLDALPVHLLAAGGEPPERTWHERFVEQNANGFHFVDRAVTNEKLRARISSLPPAPNDRYETEINLAALDWIVALAPKLIRGLILVADYGLARAEFYSPSRTTGTLQAFARHRALASPLENSGDCDLTAHVEWTSLVERAQESGLTISGFADQHHFLTGLLASSPALAQLGATQSRALQTLLHPEFLGRKFQFLGLTKNFARADSLGGFRFARNEFF